MSITVYTTEQCNQCTATKKALERKGIAFEAVHVERSDEEQLERLRGMGFQQFPVVIAGDLQWAGFRPDMISKIAA
jgi:glutaredoxin-like protein NrdH